jgi:phenylacetate-CoA ligase
MSSYQQSIYDKLPDLLQNLALSWYGKKIKEERFCGQYFESQQFFETSQYLSLDQLEEYQNDKLKKVIAHAYEYVPYYRKIFEGNKLTPHDITRKEDLQRLPILTKRDIKNNFNDLISRRHKRNQLKLGHTSGTTGAPLEILWDRPVDILHNAAIWRHRNWAGFHFGDRYATLLGRVIVPIRQKRPSFYRVNKPWNQYLFSSFHLSEENLKYYFDDFSRLDIKYMEAYPSTAYILAKYLEQHNLYCEMRAIVTSSETLLPIQREIIEERFKCRVYDYYGMAERVMFSGECEMHSGHHVHMEYGITEITDDSDNPVSIGTPGKLVLTGLHNYGMPLIRYEIGDVSAFKKEKCGCGRTLPLLESVTTKAEDIVVTREGRLISSSVLTHPFKPMHNIEKSQIIQEDYDQLLIKIVRRPGYSDTDTKQLVQAMGQRVGNNMHILVEFVDDIPVGKNGKYRWVVSTLPIKFGQKESDNLFEK